MLASPVVGEIVGFPTSFSGNRRCSGFRLVFGCVRVRLRVYL